MRRLTIIIALLISIIQLNANDLVTTIEANIKWETSIDKNGEQILVFENANYDLKHRTLPLYIHDVPLNVYGDMSIEFTDVVYETLEFLEKELLTTSGSFFSGIEGHGGRNE